MLRDNCIDTIDGPPQSLVQNLASNGSKGRLSWRAWLAQGCAMLSGDIQRLWAVVKMWHRRSCSRAQLAYLDDRMLEDIGLTRDAADKIARKPFWKA